MNQEFERISIYNCETGLVRDVFPKGVRRSALVSDRLEGQPDKISLEGTIFIVRSERGYRAYEKVRSDLEAHGYNVNVTQDDLELHVHYKKNNGDIQNA